MHSGINSEGSINKLKTGGILIYSGLIFYLINYSAGWLLRFKMISVSKKIHQLMFAVIIINLLFILAFAEISSSGFILCIMSIMMMVIIPFGKSGGIYHMITGSAGLLLYIILFTNYLLGNI
ncbi:MAG TPA: hypothetical protein PK536_10925 [Ignavibacteria bacterium]|nr:hypothetical protein [Bacteroidota bacterium]HRI85946.1 hypothetical protein [Ignavibacteria bacterium]